ncbi:MAG: RnfABCDGE type electron transport complex subunit B [Ruminococcaceae bacterium]|nr:RnfABCDGE type electron transport complex subunit B [Oscillospiraceae bacterium]
MSDILNIVLAVVWFLVIGGALGVALSFAAKFLKVKEDPRIEEITENLPSANCGGCGYAGCAAMAEAIAKGEAKPSKCAVASPDAIKKISEIMGIEAEQAVRMRAQVMCSGTSDRAKLKYEYEGVNDCIAATKLAGGHKLCPNGCMGYGTCVEACKFDAIKIINGTAAVDYHKCQACGACVNACPKGLIQLVPFDAEYWVGCKCTEKGANTKKWCEVGCIGCKMCEKACPSGAITVVDNLARIDYSACTNCGKCAEICPRHIIWSSNLHLASKADEKAEDVTTEEN